MQWNNRVPGSTKTVKKKKAWLRENVPLDAKSQELSTIHSTDVKKVFFVKLVSK